MIAGAIGLYVGYLMLFFAPGQAYRYAGMAVKNTPISMITTRGPLRRARARADTARTTRA
jgi:hypothetical protein